MAFVRLAVFNILVLIIRNFSGHSGLPRKRAQPADIRLIVKHAHGMR